MKLVRVYWRQSIILTVALWCAIGALHMVPKSTPVAAPVCAPATPVLAPQWRIKRIACKGKWGKSWCRVKVSGAPSAEPGW